MSMLELAVDWMVRICVFGMVLVGFGGVFFVLLVVLIKLTSLFLINQKRPNRQEAAMIRICSSCAREDEPLKS